MEEDILNEKVEEIPEETEEGGEEGEEEKVESLGDFYYINETFRIDKDSRQYILQRKCKTEKAKVEREFWANIGFYPDLGYLYRHLVDLRIRETSLNDLKAVYEEVKKLHEEINREYPQE